MEDNIQLNIVSPEKTLFNGKVNLVTLPGELGLFTVLHNHAPLISSLVKGGIKYISKGEEQEMAIAGGFVEVNQNVVSVCVEQDS